MTRRSNVGRSSPGPVLARRRRPPPSWSLARHVLLWATWVVLVAFVIGLVRHGPDFEPLVDGWLGAFSQILPAAVCWCALPTAGNRRREVAVTACAVSLFAAGNLVYLVAAWRGIELAFPSLSDAGYLAFYPLMLVAVSIAAQRQRPGAGRTVWLDGALGGLGAAAVLAVVLERVLIEAAEGSLEVGVALVYPVFDLLLIATVVGIVAHAGWRFQRYWLLLMIGLVLLAITDVDTALVLADDGYAVGSWADAMWSAGMVLVSMWARARPAVVPPASKPVTLAVPRIATGAGLVVLVVAARQSVSGLAVGLATLTQLASVARTQFAFHQLRRVSDLRRQATTDELTGLPNRRAFYDTRINLEVSKGRGVQALLLLDLDRFKEVNDSLGHHVGDQLLCEVGARLSNQLRDGDVLARLGGDEFAVLLGDVTREQAVAVAVKLRAAVAEPCVLEGIALRTDVSIGLSFAPEHGSDLTLLLRRADIAMYKAKRAREGHRVYTGSDDTLGQNRLRALQELHVAMTEGQMTLHYQPKLDLLTNDVHGVEALVRWDHPELGLLYPDSFLDLIEDAGLMPALTQIVLAQALDQAAAWIEQGRLLVVAVNLSASSLIDSDLPEDVAALLADRNLAPSVLLLEITEEFLMADRARARAILARVRAMGVRIAVDDFGTGYSSLSYLRELPIDELKLDRSFVFPMADDARAAALVFSTIDLAHSLGLRMVAEGVESRTALVELTRHGCDEAQGYHICRPLPAAELDHWLATRVPVAIEPQLG